jgi:ribonuclease Z
VHFAFLGTSSALPSPRRDNSAMVFVGPRDCVLVDCGGSPMQKLLLAAVDPATLAHVVITHLHADHAYGLPALVQSLILMRREAPLTVSCREEHVEPLRAVLAAFGLLGRPGAFPLALTGVAARQGAPVAATASFRITAAPNDHGSMPNLAVRVDAGEAGAVVYSSDTSPCDAVVELARGAETLVHEATFSAGRKSERVGAHSTAAEAGEIAARAGVHRLILTHIDPAFHDDPASLVREAAARFPGEVEIAEELVPYPIPARARGFAR